MNKQINVLNIITIIEDGGLERHVYYILSNKSDPLLNYKVIVLTGRRDNQLTKKYESLGIEIKYFNFDNRFSSLKSLIHNILQIFKIANFIRVNKINVIHSHDFFPAFIARLSAIVSFFFFFHRVKRIYITLHIVFYWLKPLHHFINRVLGIFTTNIVCLSYAIMNYSLTEDKLSRKKYTIIYTGVDTTKFIPNGNFKHKFISEFNLNENNIIIGNIGVLSVRKGHKYLLEAFNSIYKYNKNIRLLIFGSEREHELEIRDDITDFIDINGINKVVQIINPREDINEIYNLFDIFVMPSITEGLSACAIEALLMKRVCLFSDIEPSKELVTNNENGFLFKNKDAIDLEEKLSYIINNISKLDYIRENALKSVSGKFDVRNMVEKYEKLYLK